MKYLIVFAMVLGMVSSIQAKASTEAANTCAVAYQYQDFDGAVLTISNHQNIPNLRQVALSSHHSWENRISSIVVGAGCTLTLYQYDGYQGAVQSYSGTSGRSFVELASLERFDNLTSSLACSCAH